MEGEAGGKGAIIGGGWRVAICPQKSDDWMDLVLVDTKWKQKWRMNNFVNNEGKKVTESGINGGILINGKWPKHWQKVASLTDLELYLIGMEDEAKNIKTIYDDESCAL